MTNYYIGETAFNKSLKPLPFTFFQLVSKLSVPKILDITRDDYLELPDSKEDADILGLPWRGKAKDTTYITPCWFDPPIRATKNAKRVNLLCLKIDNPDDAKPFTASDDGADTLSALLGNLNYIAYTPATSTKEKPELHILVEANNVTIEQYPDAVKTVAGYLGVTPNEASFKVTQPMYWPSVFRGDRTSPVIGYRVNGVPLIGASINKPPPGDLDDLGCPPVDGVTPDMTREILSYLRKDDAYVQWRKVAAALKHQYIDDAATGYKLFKEWSARVDPNFDEKECARKLESFKPNLRSGNSITLRTLMQAAAKRGWRGLSELNKNVYVKIQTWLNSLTYHHSAALTPSILVKKAFSKLLRVPNRKSVEEYELLIRIKQTITRLFDTSYSLGVIKQHWKGILKRNLKKSCNYSGSFLAG